MRCSPFTIAFPGFCVLCSSGPFALGLFQPGQVKGADGGFNSEYIQHVQLIQGPEHLEEGGKCYCFAPFQEAQGRSAYTGGVGQCILSFVLFSAVVLNKMANVFGQRPVTL
jgi:hypothetical protein